jgi:hypothetical protein
LRSAAGKAKQQYCSGEALYEVTHPFLFAAGAPPSAWLRVLGPYFFSPWLSVFVALEVVLPVPPCGAFGGRAAESFPT